ncbi:MAG: protoglobin domain-containing protein [Pirellulaceae bacterium]
MTDDVIAFRKEHLARYLTKLVTEPYDGKLVTYLDFVGKIHASFGRKQFRYRWFR